MKIEYEKYDDYGRAIITFTDGIDYQQNELSSDIDNFPHKRVYFDFNNSYLESDIKKTMVIDDGFIKNIRSGQYDENIVRVVFDLEYNIKYSHNLNSESNIIIIQFTKSKPKQNHNNSEGESIEYSAGENRVHKLKDDNHGQKLPSNTSNSNDDIDDDQDEDITQENKNKVSGAFDPDSRPPLSFKVNDYLSFGSKVNFDLELRENTEDLDKDKDDTINTLESEFTIAGLFNPIKNIDVYAEGRFRDYQVLKDEPNEESEDLSFKFRRLYLYWRDFLEDDFDFKLGRQRIKDDREWIYDEHLDAIRFIYKPEPLSIEFSVSSQLIDVESEKKKPINYILYSRYKYNKKEKIALYSVIRQGREDSGDDGFFFGGSWRVRPLSSTNKVWIDTALSIQRDDNKDFVQGFGIDVGITKRFRRLWEPSFTIASAFGSENFRQTGLQDNNSTYNGKTKFKYYGELLDPELANLYIGSIGFGIIPIKKARTSFDIVYHYYSQVEKSDELVDSDIDEDPDGDSADIGQEVDLIFGTNITNWIKLSLVFGAFFPGDAFKNNDTAYFGQTELQFSFK